MGIFEVNFEGYDGDRVTGAGRPVGRVTVDTNITLGITAAG